MSRYGTSAIPSASMIQIRPSLVTTKLRSSPRAEVTKTGSARPDATSWYANPVSDACPAVEPGAVESAPVVTGAAPEVVPGGSVEEGSSIVEVSAADPSEVAPTEFVAP